MTPVPDLIGRRGRSVLFAATASLVVATGSVVAQHRPGGYDGSMMDGWGIFGGGFLWLPVLVVLLVLAVAAVGGRDRSRDAGTDRALAELRERYARGELDEDEFEKRRRTLREAR